MRIRFTLCEQTAQWLSRHLRGILHDDTTEFDRQCRERALVAQTPGSLAFSWTPEHLDLFIARLDLLATKLWDLDGEEQHRHVIRVVGYLKERKHRAEWAAKQKKIKLARQRATGATR